MRLPPSGAHRRSLALSAAGLAGLALAVAWIATHEWRHEEGRLAPFAAHARSGDEPHYLVTLHSLLYDGDLDLADDYEAAAAGGPEAGLRFRGLVLDHHTIVIDPDTGRTALWQGLFRHRHRIPCEGERCVPFEAREPHDLGDPVRWVETPAHPPAFAALLAVAVAPFSPAPEAVERAVGPVLLAIALATLLATAALSLHAGLGPGGALLAAALLALASPWLGYTKSLFPDGAAALPLALGLWALVAGQGALVGLAVSAAMWLKPALAVVGAGWILERFLAGDRRTAFGIAAVMTACGLALVAFNHTVLGEVVVAGAQPAALADGLERFFDTLVHKRYGVLLFAPWIVVGLSGVGLRRAGEGGPRLWRWTAIAAALWLGVLSLYAGLGGTCYGPRYWIPLMPFFAVATAGVMVHAGRGVRALAAVLALLTSLTVIPAALQYDRVFDERPYGGLLLMLRGRP